MPGEWIVAVFPSRAALTSALDQLKHLKSVHIRRAAIVAKAESGEIVVLDDEIGADEGGIAGGTLGMAITAFGMVQLGALAVPGIGVMILVTGALVGAIVGNLTARIGLSLFALGDKTDELYKPLAHQLSAGCPALVLEVQNSAAAAPILKDVLAKHRGELVEHLPEPAMV